MTLHPLAQASLGGPVLIPPTLLTLLCSVAWMAAFTAEAVADESAAYRVIEKYGDIEIRRYPDLVLASTPSKLDSGGRDGSFGRLFRYIRGNNATDQKISMTTPVFMEGDLQVGDVAMGFVMPKKVADSGPPKPQSEDVQIRRRPGGDFATIRFAGKLDSKLARQQEAKLREWMQARGLRGQATVEAAGYDPPFKPAFLRRNEVLIRLLPKPESREPGAGIKPEGGTPARTTPGGAR